MSRNSPLPSHLDAAGSGFRPKTASGWEGLALAVNWRRALIHAFRSRCLTGNSQGVKPVSSVEPDPGSDENRYPSAPPLFLTISMWLWSAFDRLLTATPPRSTPPPDATRPSPTDPPPD